MKGHELKLGSVSRSARADAKGQSRNVSASDSEVCLPDHQALMGRIAPGWSLHKPLNIQIERDEDGVYVASDDVFAVHGDGETKSEALKDFIVSFIDYYELLSARASGDEPTAALFRRLQEHLEKIDD